MYFYYLAIGSNIGDTVGNINKATTLLRQNNYIKILKIAPYYFNHPLLPKNADESYYKIFCNTAIEIETSLNPFDLLQFIKQIETKMKRKINHTFWSPRIIDIDILYCKKHTEEVKINTELLTIPHKELFNRAFVLDPLSQLNSTLKINNKSILKLSRKHYNHQSCVMGIVNITDNSFSKDGSLNIDKIKQKIQSLVNNAIPIIDIGCEATNPDATFLSYQEEIDRLRHIVEFIKEIKKTTFATKFSIDTYHPETAEYAIQNNFDIINDVNGFKNQKMWNLMQKYPNVETIIMHSLTPHSDKQVVIDKNKDIINLLNQWVIQITKEVKRNKIELNRIILDYGIGFGKTSFQSLQILKNINNIKNNNFRVLIGHSKKSFISLFSNSLANERTFETIGLSLKLQQKNIDIIRVHDAIETQKAILGFQSII